MLVYKIAHKKYADALSASGVDGRWTPGQRMVIYCADSIALALLENMVRRQGVGFNEDFRTMIVDIPDVLRVETVATDDLDPTWRGRSAYTVCQPHGNQWYDGGKTAVLRVPSAILPESNNFVLNTRHRDFKKIQIVAITDLQPDERI